MSTNPPHFGNAPVRPCQRCGMPIHGLVCSNCGYQHAPVSGSTGQLHAAWGNVQAPNTPQAGYRNPPASAYGHTDPSQQIPFPGGGRSVSSPQLPMPGWGGRPSGQLPPLPQGRPSGQLPPLPQGRPSGQLTRPSGQLPMPPQASGHYPTASRPSQPHHPYVTGSFPPVQVAEPPVSQRRRGRPVMLTIGLLVLVALVVGGGWFGYNQFLASQGAASSPQPTAAATFVPKLPATFSDSFKDNAKGWNTQSAPGKFSAKVGNGALVLEDDEHHLLWEIVPSKEKSAVKPYGNFNDFKLLVDAQLSKGDQNNSYGLFFRGALDQKGELASYYRFAIYSDGSYAIFKGKVGTDGKYSTSALVEYKKNQAVKAGNEINHLMVTAKGASLTFSINGQTLETVNDTSYQSGVIALFVSNLKEAQGGAQATFSNLAIYPADA